MNTPNINQSKFLRGIWKNIQIPKETDDQFKLRILMDYSAVWRHKLKEFNKLNRINRY